jgi:hypothetical protein
VTARRGAMRRSAGPGAAAAEDQHCLFPLTGVRLGLWKPRSAWSAYLLVLPAARKFVVLLTRVDARKVRLVSPGVHALMRGRMAANRDWFQFFTQGFLNRATAAAGLERPLSPPGGCRAFRSQR